MKLALIIDDYLPHSTRVGAKMFHELALELHANGHDITVITPNYQQNVTLTIDKLDGITVWRFKSGPVKGVGRTRRAINETLLSFRTWRAINKHVMPNTFDGIVYYSPSIFWGRLINKLKKRCRCPSYLILRDLFPQWAIEANIIKQGSLIERYFRLFEHYSYKQADQIGLMSQKNLELFNAMYGHYPCEVLRNWANVFPVSNNNKDYISIRTRLNLNDKVIFFYGGNMGHAQDMANLMRLAKNMQSYENAHFLFIGQGDEVELVNSLAQHWQLSNFSYLASVNQNEFKSILAEIDIGLFSLAASHSSHNFPGKLLGYMVESLPILGSVNRGNDLLGIINHHHAGFIHINGEDEKLLSSALKLYTNTALRKMLGHNAKQLLIDQFSVNSVARLIETRLENKHAVN